MALSREPHALPAQGAAERGSVSLRPSAQRDTTLTAAFRGRAVASYVLVEAADGYRVVYSLEEVGARGPTPSLLLVDRRNGEPMSPDEGPLRVIAPEARHSRWIRQVARISVREAAP